MTLRNVLAAAALATCLLYAQPALAAPAAPATKAPGPKATNATKSTHAKPPTPTRSFAAADLVLDPAPATQVLALWTKYGRDGSQDGASRAQAKRIADSPPYTTLRRYLREQFACIPTAAEAARAIELPDSGICGLGLDPAFRYRNDLSALAAAVTKDKTAICARASSRAAAYLPTARAWKPVHVWFLIASQSMFDAATLPPATDRPAPVILVNLTEVLAYGETTRDRIETLEHVLAHETFHAGMREVEPDLPGWKSAEPAVADTGSWGGNTANAASDIAQVTRVMLDEGVAHYIDWQDRPGADSLFTWTPSMPETKAFAQLSVAIHRLKQPGDEADRLEVLQLAGNGPLWSKYGAISGMFAAHRIEMARGRAALRRAVAAGPVAFIRAYREVAAHNPVLNGVPRDLLLGQ